MKKILVTGVGGGVGQSILKALQETYYGLVGVDADELAAGLHAVETAYKGLYATDPNFVDRLLEICRVEGCNIIFPGLDFELAPLAANVARFQSEGVTPIVSSQDVIRICDDKLATHDFLKAHGFPVPRTHRLKDITSIHYPVVIKPQRGGSRSSNTYLIRSAAEFDVYKPLVDPENCIVQEYLDGDEYTCGTVTLDGRCRGVIVMRRTLRAGDTYKAFVERNKNIESMVSEIVEVLKPFGACNVQLRIINDVPVVFEINARCSGTTAARALAGFNEPRMIADHLLANIEPTYSIREIGVLRYWQELVVTNKRIQILGETGHLVGDGNKL